jgi:GNAT superfamily N-acetyltransferase
MAGRRSLRPASLRPHPTQMPFQYRHNSEGMDVHRLDALPSPRFDCGREEQNEFLHRYAWTDQGELLSTTYLFHVDGLLAAYSTVCVDGILLARDERPPEVRFGQVSALKLAQLGVHASFQGRGIGRQAVKFVVGLAREVGDTAAVRYVVVDAKPDLVDWYADLGFTRNRLRQEERIRHAVAHRRDPEKLAVSMRFDLKRASGAST